VSKRLSVLVAVVALAVGGAPLAVAATPHQPKQHGNGGGGSNGKGSNGKGGKQQKNCHNLPCH
jgi:hypothetical protein